MDNGLVFAFFLLVPVLGTLFVPLFARTKFSIVSFLRLFLTAYLALVIFLWIFGPTVTSFSIGWFTDYPIHLSFYLDELAWCFLLLTSFLFAFAAYACELKRDSTYAVLFLAMLALINGVFLAEDLFLFYIFWEVGLIPIFFLILRYGGKMRLEASLKFFFFSFIGSLALLFSIIGLAWLHDFSYSSFSLLWLSKNEIPFHIISVGNVYFNLEIFLFWAMGLGLAVKIPLVPFHSWLPAAHVQAPTELSVLLAGVLLKLGIYGFLRVLIPIFPASFMASHDVILFFAFLSIAHASLVALAQTDAKALVAFSSIAHMGIAVLGMATGVLSGLQGALILSLSHGLTSPLLFFLVGKIEKSYGHRSLIPVSGQTSISGLAKNFPFWNFCFVFALFASLGLPGASNFIGELFILVASFELSWKITAGLLFLLALGASYHLYFYYRWSPGNGERSIIKSLNIEWMQKMFMAFHLLLLLFFGLYPQPWKKWTGPYFYQIQERLEKNIGLHE